jgi:hypothetical protein
VTVPTPAVTMLIAALFLSESIALHEVLAMATIAIGLYGLLFAGQRARRAVVT